MKYKELVKLLFTNTFFSPLTDEGALASLAYAGIKTTTFWLFGYPGETEADFQETLEHEDFDF